MVSFLKNGTVLRINWKASFVLGDNALDLFLVSRISIA